MKKLIIISLGLLMFMACKKKPTGTSGGTSTGDSVFNGSYLQIAYNGKNFNSKSVTVGSRNFNVILTNTVNFSAGARSTIVQIVLQTPSGISGTSYAVLYFRGDGGVGSYDQLEMKSFGYISQLFQTSPATLFSDTSGTASITHMGTDYLEGTFSITLYTSGLSYPATGSFKVYH